MTKPMGVDLQYKSRPVISEFKGINTGLSPFKIGDGQAVDMKNIDSREYPVLKVRDGRKHLASVEGTPRFMGTINDTHLSVVSGNKWRYFNGSAWTDIYTVEENDGDGVIFRGKNIYVCGSSGGGYCYEGTTKTRLNKMPVAHFITTNANRLYAASKNESYLHCSDLGDAGANSWTEEGSGTFEVITPNAEKCSGITAFNGRIIFFKPHSLHELYGTGPATYQMVAISGNIGCAAHRSIKEISQRLYWLGDTVYVYGGGAKPSDIGLPIKRYLDNAGDLTKACAGTDGERYYLCLPQSSGKILLVYDTRIGEWYAEDNIDIEAFATFQNKLYGITSDGKIYRMISDESESTGWYWHSKYFSSGSPSMTRNLHSVYITHEKADRGAIKLEIVNNREQSSERFGKAYVSSRGSIEVTRIMLQPAFCFDMDWFQVRLSGVGTCKVHNIEFELRTKKGSY